MQPSTLSRRDLLRRSAGLAGVAALGSLAGCEESLSGSDAASRVPASADYLVDVDVAAMLDDDALRDGIEDLLRELPTAAGTSVADLLDRVEESAGLDPRAVSGALAFGNYATEPQAGVVLSTEWSDEEFVDALDGGVLDSSTSESYGDATLYPTAGGQPGRTSAAGVLGDGAFALGTADLVRSYVDVGRDEADALSGAVRSAFDDAEAGYVQFATAAPASLIPPEATGGSFDVGPLRKLETAYGSVGQSGGDHRVAVNFRTGSEESAGDVADLVDGGLVLAEQRLGSAENTFSSAVRTLLDETEVTSDGSVAAVSYEGDVRPVVVGAGSLVFFLVGFGNAVTSGSTVTGSESSSTESDAPQVSFSFEYESTGDDAGRLTITHEGGDSIPPDRLAIRGVGFADVDGVDLTAPGRWPSGTDPVAAGDSITVGARPDYEFGVVFRGAESGVVLAEAAGPEA